ncbi:MAG: tetratricopeptide repeat protein [Opitutaceae bacterium]
MISFKRSIRIPLRQFALALLIGLFCGISPVSAQVKETLADQIQRATTLIHSRQLVEARPLLQKLKNNEQINKEMHPQLDFYIALSYIFEFYDRDNKGALDTGLENFQAFLKAYPKDSMAPLARYNVADIYAISKKFKEALQWYIPLYNNPVPGVERKEVLKKIVMIYVAEQKWEAGLPYFEASVRTAEDATERTTSAAYLMIALAKKGDLGDSRQILEFFKNPAPVFYTPRFNAALMDVGDQLKEEGDLPTASLFYQFVRPYETLEIGLSNHVRNLERRVANLEGNTVMRNFYLDAKTELDNALADLAAVRASKNYTPLLHWRIASVYMDMGRDWEAFWRFRLMVDKYPKHEYAEDILFSAYSLGRKLDQLPIAEELSTKYFSNDDYKKYRGTIADEMSTIYQEREMYDKLFELTYWYVAREGGDSAAALLMFKHGMARLIRLENQKLIDDFSMFRSKHGKTKNAVVINYFLGLGHLLEQDNQEALDRFEEVIADPNPRFRADASFRKALAVMGLDRIAEARDLIVDFIDKWPDNPLRAQAELVLGNLVDMLGDSSKALSHYYQIEQHTDDVGLLAQGELKISIILVDMGKQDSAIERLEKFIKSYGNEPESVPVVKALANIYNDMGEPRFALNLIKDTLTRFYTLAEVDQIDGFLVEYIKKDRELREMEVVTKAFFKEVAESPELFRELVEDRAKQYRYFKDHPLVDGLVKERFVKDNVYRMAITDHFAMIDKMIVPPEGMPPVPNALEKAYESHPVSEIDVFVELKDEVDALNKQMPEIPADTWLKVELKKAKSEGNVALAVRIMAAFARAEEPEGRPDMTTILIRENAEVWATLGVASKLWILGEIGRINPIEVSVVLEENRLEYMNTSVELEMLELHAKCYQKIDSIDQSIEKYKTLIKRFPTSRNSGLAALEIGKMEIGRKHFDEAREILESLLHRNEWRGQMHGDALLWIGRAYVEEGKLPEAHGFFERIMLGYPGFQELLAQGYYEDMKVLKAMGEPESVKTVYEAFMITPGLEDTAAAELIRKEFE